MSTRQTRSNGSKFVIGVISRFLKLDLSPAPPGRTAIWACKLSQKSRAGKSKGPSEETIALVLLRDAEVPVKLHSKQQSLSPFTRAPGSFGWKNSFLQGSVMTAECLAINGTMTAALRTSEIRGGES